MKTMQPTRKDTSEPVVSSSRPSSEAGAHRGMSAGLVAAMVALGMAAGLFVGFLLWGTGGDSTDPIVAGGGELTARQEQMVDMIDDYLAAWKAGDGEAAVALFTADGTMTWGRYDYRVVDGTLASLVERMPTPSLELLEPFIVEGNTVFSYQRLLGSTAEDIFEFTSTGDLAIRRHLLTG